MKQAWKSGPSRTVLTRRGWHGGPRLGGVFPLPADGLLGGGSDESMQTWVGGTRCQTSRTAHCVSEFENHWRQPPCRVALPGAGPSGLPGRRILPAGPSEGLVVNLPEHRLLVLLPQVPARCEQDGVINTRVSIETRWTGASRGVSASHRHDSNSPAWYPPEFRSRKDTRSRWTILLLRSRALGPGTHPLGDFAMRRRGQRRSVHA